MEIFRPQEFWSAGLAAALRRLTSALLALAARALLLGLLLLLSLIAGALLLLLSLIPGALLLLTLLGLLLSAGTLLLRLLTLRLPLAAGLTAAAGGLGLPRFIAARLRLLRLGFRLGLRLGRPGTGFVAAEDRLKDAVQGLR